MGQGEGRGGNVIFRPFPNHSGLEGNQANRILGILLIRRKRRRKTIHTFSYLQLLTGDFFFSFTIPEDLLVL